MDEANWTQLEYLNWYYQFLESDWEEYIEYAENNNFQYKEINILRNMARRVGSSNTPSIGQLRWAKNITNRIEMNKQRDEFKDSMEQNRNTDEVKHLTVRVAWHDNKWNGNICKDPANNIYCNGYHSLLSARIRKRKRADLESKYKGCNISVFKKKEEEKEDQKYFPPCFWSLNAFGNDLLQIRHDNPAAPELIPIDQDLKPHSVFSWPFALSFCRDYQTSLSDGKYPRNLEDVRIPKFQQKFQPNKSLVFLYANYDNPISEGEQPGEKLKYLVVGCGFIRSMEKTTRFEKPQSVFDDIRKKPGLRNFPNINWALQYTLDYPENFIRLPYHEYLKDAEQSQNYDRLHRMKVTIDENELIHCFKYVAMDIDDDEAIFVLSKIRQKLMLIRDEGIVDPNEVDNSIEKVERFLEYCWQKRGYFPGFEKLARIILNREESEKFYLSRFIQELKQKVGDDYAEKFIELLHEPDSDPNFQSFENDLFELHDTLIDNRGIQIDDFIKLCMLNFSFYQFERIVNGELGIDKKSKKQKTQNIKAIYVNPYLIFEEYMPETETIDFNTGEQKDQAIGLFKIDIAFFPDTRYLRRLKIQRRIRNNDQRRVRALIIDHLKNLETYGHCFDDADTIQENLKNYPLFYHIDQEYILPENFLMEIDDDYEAHLSKKLEIINEHDSKYFYLNYIYQAEQYISNVIKKLLQKGEQKFTYTGLKNHLNTSCLKLHEELHQRFNDKDEKLFREERTILYNTVFRKNIFLLTGSPGSGKSFELLNIVTQLTNNNETYILLAPTGKATLRLSTDEKYPNIKAKTIDKFLSDVENSKERPIVYNNIIVDEMSMVDLLKFESLLKCFNFDNPTHKRLILVGDQYQLPPIGFGKVFADIIKFVRMNPEFTEHFIELESNCRQELDDSIIEFSKIYSNLNIDYETLIQKVSAGEKLSEKFFNVCFWEKREELYDQIEDKFKALDNDNKYQDDKNALLDFLFSINDDGTIDFSKKPPFNLDTFQILSPYRSGASGIIKINSVIQNEYRKDVDYLKSKKITLRKNDKIIQTKNIYKDGELILSNGSTGLAVHKGHDAFYFPERSFEPTKLKDLDPEWIELAYCITIHKAQGSGFDHVFVIIPKRNSILSKELFYTAITRSKRSLTLFVEGQPTENLKNSIFEKLRNRSYTETRKTSLLGLPFWDFSLEPESGIFVQSRAEYIIYRQLKDFCNKYDGFKFEYEEYPIVNGKTLKMKTDFTIYTDTGYTFYWEHLGLLGNRYYENKWQFKYGKYKEADLLNILLTTDERRGINDDKISQIIEQLRKGELTTEDKYNHYSEHHYYLR